MLSNITLLSDYELTALLLSLKVAGYAVLWLLPIGLGIGWLLARKEFVGKSVLDSLVHLPLVLPPVVVGYLLLISMGKQGAIGQWLDAWFGISFSFSWRGAVLACVVIALPLMVRSIRLSLESVDPKLEQAARTLGASPLKVFATITLPLTLPGVITGIMLSFARSLVSLVRPSVLSRISPVRRKLFRWQCITFWKHRVQRWKQPGCALFLL